MSVIVHMHMSLCGLFFTKCMCCSYQEVFFKNENSKVATRYNFNHKRGIYAVKDFYFQIWPPAQPESDFY